MTKQRSRQEPGRRRKAPAEHRSARRRSDPKQSPLDVATLPQEPDSQAALLGNIPTAQRGQVIASIGQTYGNRHLQGVMRAVSATEATADPISPVSPGTVRRHLQGIRKAAHHDVAIYRSDIAAFRRDHPPHTLAAAQRNILGGDATGPTVTTDSAGRVRRKGKKPKEKPKEKATATATGPKVVKIGTEEVEVDSAKEAEEKAEAEQILKTVKDTYGVEISSPKLIEGIKAQYTDVPTRVTDTLQSRSWRMIELRAIAKALAYYAPILGKTRESSTRKGTDQEIAALGKAKNAIDINTPAGQLDTTTLGEYFKGKKVMGIFKSSEGATPDFSSEEDQLVGTFVHETAHGLLAYAYDDFVAASDGYWTDQITKSGTEDAEEPPTAYGQKNAREDLCETAMIYFVDPERLKAGSPIRYAFMKKLGKSWLPPVKDAPQVKTEQ